MQNLKILLKNFNYRLISEMGEKKMFAIQCKLQTANGKSAIFLQNGFIFLHEIQKSLILEIQQNF